MKFFFDNNLSKKLAFGMKAFGEDAIHLQDIFPENTADEIWLDYIGKKNYILITKDTRILKNPAEKIYLKKHNVGAFFLTGKSLDRCKMIQNIVKNWPKIKKIAVNSKPPFAFRIRSGGGKFEPIPL
jgi:hypothetical protein